MDILHYMMADALRRVIQKNEKKNYICASGYTRFAIVIIYIYIYVEGKEEGYKLYSYAQTL